MNGAEQVIQAREQLKNSVNTAVDDLKNYGKAVFNQANTALNQRKLQFKEGVKQKTSSFFGKLGTIANNSLSKLREAKERVTDFATTQMANYYNWQDERREERERQAEIRQEEIEREAEIRERTREHKEGMKEALKAQDIQQRQERMLRFKEGIKQKANAVTSRLGQLRTSLVEKLRPSNLDVKFRDMMERAQIAGLVVANKSKEAFNTVKENVTDFATTQMANYYNWQDERREENVRKAFERAAKLAEKEELEKAKAQLKERKQAMIEALNAQEREIYEQKHQENETKKQELLTSLFGESFDQTEGTLARAR